MAKPNKPEMVFTPLERTTDPATNTLEVVLKKKTGKFHLYRVGDFHIRFRQEPDTGDIYSVTVCAIAGAKEMEAFSISVEANETPDGRYYPDNFRIRTHSPRMDADAADEYAANLQKASAALRAIENFFKTSSHYQLFQEKA